MTIEITESEFARISEIIYRESGIFYTFNKKYLIENRLTKRLKDLEISSFSQYLKFVEDDGNLKETERLVNAITTNETSFLRNEVQFKSFTDSILPEVIKHNRSTGRKKIRLWSAASSSGEEIYTIAILLKESGLIPPDWSIELHATDINRDILALGREGLYSKHTLRNLSPELLEKYFDRQGGLFAIKKEKLLPVKFEQYNLMGKRTSPQLSDFDIAFCCNVLIYFSDEAKAKAIAGIAAALHSSGYLFIGHSESLRKISKDFKLINVMGSPTYKKD